MAETLYRHKKRGTVYRILHEATMQYSGSDSTHEYGATISHYLDDYPVVVYQDVNDPRKVWVRMASEFFDGRFEEVVQ